MIDAYVKAYQTAELDDRDAPIRELSNAELMRIAAGAYDDRDQRASKLLLLNPR